jgi:hypothetical protein
MTTGPEPKVTKSKLDGVLNDLGITKEDILSQIPTSSTSTSTKTPKPSTNVYPSISSPTDATALINKVFEAQLQRPATAAEMKYWKPLLAEAQAKGGAVQKYKVAGKTGTQTTTSGLNEEVWLGQQLANNTDYKKALPDIDYAAELNAVKTTDPALFARKQEKALYDAAIAGAKGDPAKIATIKATTAYGRGLTDVKAAIESLRLAAGAEISDDEIAAIAQEAYDKGLDREKNTLNKFIDSKFKFGATSAKGEAGKAVTALTKVAAANGLDLQKAFGSNLPSWLEAINKGESVDTFAKQIREVAKIGMPEKVAKLIDQGIDLDTIYSPYKNIMANTLEINPETIDMSDPTLRSAITADSEVPLYQFERQLRGDNRWQYTNQAKSEVANATQQILKDFGFMG